MHLSIHNCTLLREMLAGAVALAGVSACSRSNRADAGSAATDTMVTAADTTAAPRQAATPSPRSEQGASGYQAMGHDSAQVSANVSQPVDSSALGDSAAARNADTLANPADSDRIRTAGDSTEVLEQAATDTTASGYEPMARDTSTALAEGDTTAQGQVDSTAVLSNVTSDRTEANSDVEAIGDEEAVGAAQMESTGTIVTGAEAVALMSRGGQPCQVVKLEESSDAQWDLASSPATLNPCGTGTMTLTKVQTGEEK